MNTIFKLIILLVIPELAVAAKGASLGGLAQNLMEPVGVFSDFVQTTCFLIGGAFVFASVIKYFEHRRNPLHVPISTVVFLLIAGIMLLLLPLFSYLSDSGIPYSLAK